MKNQTKETLWLYIALVVIGLASLHGCASRDEVKPVREYTQSGPCLFFDRIERQRKGQEICGISKRDDPKIWCTRELGHRGAHHCHIGKDCLAVFSD